MSQLLHVTNINESCHTYEESRECIHVSQSRWHDAVAVAYHKFKHVMSHMWMGHITRMNTTAVMTHESRAKETATCRRLCGMSQSALHHTHIHESYHTYEYATRTQSYDTGSFACHRLLFSSRMRKRAVFFFGYFAVIQGSSAKIWGSFAYHRLHTSRMCIRALMLLGRNIGLFCGEI